jgi:septal ring factor EnvC (AmiA/AmiB activator)
MKRLAVGCVLFTRSKRHIGVLCLCWLCLPLQAQEDAFGSIYTGLDSLEALMNAMQARNETLQSDVTDLSQTLQRQEEVLHERTRLIERHEQALSELQQHLTAISEAYKTQSELSKRFERRYRVWKWTALIGIPAAALAAVLIKD